MIEALRETGKRSAGWLLSQTSARYSYRNCIFILAHMRCGSTALSNVLCSRPDVSGYGEAHICYDGKGALGRLALNQMRRNAWRPEADHLFDKILHSRHDEAASPEFFEARAIFLVRRPGDTIRSIVDLFTRLERSGYDTPLKAAAYYLERLDALAALWQRFPARRRFGLTHDALMRDPDFSLARMSGHLGFQPPLENRYDSHAASRGGGAGDPLVSPLHSRIVGGLSRPVADNDAVALPEDMWIRVHHAYERLVSLFEDQTASADHTRAVMRR